MKKKVLIIMETLGGGGAEKVLIDLLNKLDYSKFSVDLLLLINQGVYLNQLPEEVNLKYLFAKKIHYRICRKISLFIRSNILLKILLSLKIKSGYDLELSFMQGVTLKIHSLIKSRIKKITWVHMDLSMDYWFKDPFFPYPEAKKAYSKMDKIVFVSNEALKVFETLFNVSCEKEVMYNPINKEEIIEKSNQLIPEKNKMTICTIGRLGPQKAIDKLIRVAKRLDDDGMDFKIWIVGEGHAENDLKELAKNLSLEKNIEFLGYKINPYPYLKSADIFISTSMSEGFSLVVAEAMCLGIPVISTRVTGPTELLDNGKYGILTSQDEDEIYVALKNVMENDAFRQELAQKSLERSSIFDFNKSLKEFEKIIGS